MAVSRFPVFSMSPNANPRQALRLLLFAAADLFGVFCVVVGASWFFAGRGAIIPGFPNQPVEAVACIAGGLAVMAWAANKLLRAFSDPGS